MYTSLLSDKASSSNLAAELVKQQIFFRRELSERVGWFIGVRWIAIVMTQIGAWMAGLFKIELSLIPITIIVLSMIGYNIIFTLLCHYLRSLSSGRPAPFVLCTHGQILCDLAALFALIFFTGGCYSPLILFGLFHIVLTGILLDPIFAYLYSAIILIAFGGLSFLQVSNRILPYPLAFDASLSQQEQSKIEMTAFFILLAVALLITAFLVTTVKHSLRYKGRALLAFCKELDTANSKLTALYYMVKHMAVCTEIKALMDAATSGTAGIMGVKACAIKLMDRHQKELHFASTYGLSRDYVSKQKIEIDKSPVNQKIISGELCSIGNIEEKDDFQYPEDIRKEGITAMICLPLKVEKRILGVFCVYSGTRPSFDQQEIDFFTLVSELTALAMQNLKRELNKSWFLQKSAHQLRSPLNAISSMLKVIRKAYLGTISKKQAEMLLQCEGRLAGLNSLIQDLLKLSLKKDGDISLSLHPTDLHSVVERVTGMFQSQAKERNITLCLALEKHLPPISAHESLLDDILTNLLSNAIKYTLPGKTISVTLKPDGKRRLCLQIIDSGIGIPEKELPHLFSEFFRAENAKALTDQGTGLGLMIVKEAMDLLHGVISIESRQNQGTRATCWFPALK